MLDKIIVCIRWICMFLLIEMVAVIFFQVVSRYCFGIAHFWAEEMAVFSMIWLVSVSYTHLTLPTTERV